MTSAAEMIGSPIPAGEVPSGSNPAPVVMSSHRASSGQGGRDIHGSFSVGSEIANDGNGMLIEISMFNSGIFSENHGSLSTGNSIERLGSGIEI